MENVIVRIINTNVVKQKFEEVLNFLDVKRKEKALKLPQEKDRLLSLAAGYLLKKYLPGREIKENKFGKPYIEGGPFFNISHSGDYSVLAIHQTREVGVDVELIDKSKVEAIRYTLNEEEKKETNIETIFKMWANKESLIKCVGLSIAEIKKVPCLPLIGERTINQKSYFTRSTTYKNYALSLTLKNNQDFDIILEEINNM